MNMYQVKITETLTMTVEVEADSELSAEQQVSDNWRNSEYILDFANFADVTFKAVSDDESTAESRVSLRELVLRRLNELMEAEVVEAIAYSTTETCSEAKRGYEAEYERQRAKIRLIQSAKDEILFSFGDDRTMDYDDCSVDNKEDL